MVPGKRQLYHAIDYQTQSDDKRIAKKILSNISHVELSASLDFDKSFYYYLMDFI